LREDPETNRRSFHKVVMVNLPERHAFVTE
jgi:hypothetical protein